MECVAAAVDVVEEEEEVEVEVSKASTSSVAVVVTDGAPAASEPTAKAAMPTKIDGSNILLLSPEINSLMNRFDCMRIQGVSDSGISV